MEHKVIIAFPNNRELTTRWLIDNLGGSLKFTFENCDCLTYYGPGWRITTVNAETQWITISEFENKEQAVLFELTWL